MTLTHFTCVDHGAVGIRESGLVRPVWQPFLHVSLSWWTDDPTAAMSDLGLTRNYVRCHRMGAAFAAVDDTGLVRWTDWCRENKPRWAVRQMLESHCRPGTWWVANVPISVVEVVQ